MTQWWVILPGAAGVGLVGSMVFWRAREGLFAGIGRTTSSAGVLAVVAGVLAGAVAVVFARPEGEATIASAAIRGVSASGFLVFALLGLALAATDAAVHRLPDRLVLPLYPVAGTMAVLVGVLESSVQVPLRAAVGACAMFGGYLMLRLVSAGGVGGGDVKLAGAIGLFAGSLGWQSLLWAACLPFLLGGLLALVLVLVGRAGRASALAFGPWMVVGLWVGVLVQRWPAAG